MFLLSQRSWRLSSVLFIPFTLFWSSEVISTILSSSSLIHSSASAILLLIPSRVFLITLIVLFVSSYLFFNSSRSLLIDSYIFFVLFSRFLIIIAIIILNSFSGSLPISSAFIWTSVFLVCSFICAIFLCLFIIFFKTYCVWGLLLSSFKKSWIISLKKVEFFLPFGFFPPKVGPVVCVNFIYGEICADFFCLFFLWWARLSEVVILSADDWVCIFLLFVV